MMTTQGKAGTQLCPSRLVGRGRRAFLAVGQRRACFFTAPRLLAPSGLTAGQRSCFTASQRTGQTPGCSYPAPTSHPKHPRFGPPHFGLPRKSHVYIYEANE